MSLCKCGCGEAIVEKRYHKYRGLPVFIQGHSTLGTKASETTRKTLSISHKGQIPWNKGKTFSIEYRRKLSDSHKGQRPNRKGFKHRQESIEKMRAVKVGKLATSETRKRMSESQRAKWLSPGFAEKVIRSWRLTPNRAEKRLMGILDCLYPGQWKFVGDGQVVIAGKCPDFINCNGEKKIIELFGDYWHRGEDVQGRIEWFRPFGFETLVIWEKELRSQRNLETKLRTFCGSENDRK